MSNITFQPISSSIVSTDSGSPVRFQLHNDSDESLTLYWVDRAGALQTFVNLNKGGSYSQDTVTSHVWEIKSADGKIAFKFTPDSAGLINIGADYKPTFSDFSEKVTQTANGLWSSQQGYGLINAAKSLGIADTVDLPMNGQNNNMALNAINAPSAWAAGFTGKGVKVAVLDIGIASSAEINSRIVDQYDFYQNDKDASPDAGPYKDHALGVASIIAASHDVHSGRDTMGVAPDAELINVRTGSSTYGSTAKAMADGLHYAVDHGAKVICMPLENSSTVLDQQVADAVHYAYQHNVVTVIIGGNYSNYGATGPAMIAQQLKGEAIDVGNYNVMTGSAFDSSNMPGANPFPWVMASSSGYVPNSAGGYTYWGDGGTSFAGPYVAGLAALLFQQNPNASATEIMNKIIAGATVGESNATANLPKATVVTGTAAIDTTTFSKTAADYKISISDTGTTVTQLDNGAQTLLTSVERLQFSDKSVAIDISGHGGDVYRLYQAAFDRTPDKSGLGFWMSAMDSGKTITEVANGFVNSAEFHNLFGANPTNSEMVTAMYHNVLHREPDAGGMNFWLGAMDHGYKAADVLAAFSSSAENVSNMVKVIGQGFDYTPFHG